MFKRLFWLFVGAGLGFGLSFWIMRFVRGTVDRYRPHRVSADVNAAFARFGKDLRAAVSEGRTAMREREAALKVELGHQTREAQPSAEQSTQP